MSSAKWSHVLDAAGDRSASWERAREAFFDGSATAVVEREPLSRVAKDSSCVQ